MLALCILAIKQVLIRKPCYRSMSRGHWSWHWKVCKESGVEQSIPDLPVTYSTSTFRSVTWPCLCQMYGQFCTMISHQLKSMALKRPRVNVMGSPKDENRTSLVLWCTHQKYGATPMILLRCGCTHSKQLWTFIRKLYSGSDYDGRRCEKLW